MEEDGCVTTSCMPVSRFDFPPLMHDPLLSSSPPCPMLESTMDSTEVALMGNLLTDMLSSDFPYTSGSRYSVPDILQFPSEHSKMTLLQMLEESDTTSYSKLPVLEEHRDQTKLFGSEHLVEASPSVIKPEPGTPVPAVVSDPNVTVSSPRSSEENNNKAAALANSQSSSGTEFTPSHQTKPKRKRIKSCKNSEEVESQRQTHIAVERNRRKQMNEHLNVLRSLMPGSYVQRGDQASIIGGAIEFVKELEQLLQCLQAQKRRRMYSEAFSPKPSPSVNSILQQPPCPFSNPYETVPSDIKYASPDGFYDPKEVVAEAKSDIADIEVKMVGNDAVVKILSQRRPGQLLKTISSLESMGLNIVHTNITTIEQTVLYTFTVKMGLESRLAVEEIAQAIQRAFNMIHTNTTAGV